ncbi:MAG: SAM-dependent chlorinase/fluorinase [Myxococcota bacterium]
MTTDFGSEDGWVGAMKGVCLRIAPTLALHDLGHAIPPQDVARGAAALAVAAPEFPPGTTHLAVVDPGVGTARAGVVVVCAGQLFVGPDNHLFDDVLAKLGGPVVAYRIARHRYLPAARSATFHGRDVFAPTAAALAAGLLRPTDVGPEHALLEPVLTPAEPHVRGVDRFGNLVTSLSALPAAVVLPDGTRAPAVGTYGDAAPGALVCLMGSEGLVELAVRDGSAAARTGLARGARLGVEA